MATRTSRTPRENVEAECRRRGLHAVVVGCVGLLGGAGADEALVLAIGGLPAEFALSGREGGLGGYWPRVWAARALLYAWEETAAPAVSRALSDESWRVREMAAKVVARHRVASAFEGVVALRDDPVARVAAAAVRAVAALTAAGA